DLGASVAGAASNQGGTLAANGNTTVTAASLNNSGGKVFGDRLRIDTQGQELGNAQGTLAATHAVELQTGTLRNDAGLVQAGGALSIDTHRQALSNTNAAGYANGQGGLASGDTLTLHAGAVDNSGGFIGSKGALSATTGDVTNSAGQVLGQSTLDWQAGAAGFDNSGGQIQSAGNLSVAAGSVTNTAGLLRSGASTTVTASGSVGNRNTQGTDQGIEGNHVVITAGSLDNTQGAVRANGNTTVTSGGTVDNTGGLLSAGDTLKVADPNAANPGAKTLNLVNTGGTLVADQSVVIDAARFSGDGKLVSGKDLALTTSQDLVNNADVIANGNLSYGTTAHLTNNGRLLAGGTLIVTGNVVDNAAAGEMSGADTLVNAGTLNNRGLIDSSGTTGIIANTVNNIGTGRIYGDHVVIGAEVLNNLAENVGGSTQAGTIAARQRLDIGAAEVHNHDGALIFSAGDLFIGGSIDASGHAQGLANIVDNHGATIQANGNVGIAAAVLANTNGGVTYTVQSTSGGHAVQYMVPGMAQTYDSSEVLFVVSVQPLGVVNGRWASWQGYSADNPLNATSSWAGSLMIPPPEYPLSRFLPYYLNSPKHSADWSYTMWEGGDDQHEVTVTEPGTWYAITDPIWATFGVAPPPSELSADNPGRTDPGISVGQAGYN
ncbi:MAG: hypothetical protein J7603_26725, partial [Pseudacidovorax sp.]|nr:hypothetical protein [Pseudacidovorax sp.]